jgi:hypothetical protein
MLLQLRLWPFLQKKNKAMMIYLGKMHSEEEDEKRRCIRWNWIE